MEKKTKNKLSFSSVFFSRSNMCRCFSLPVLQVPSGETSVLQSISSSVQNVYFKIRKIEVTDLLVWKCSSGDLEITYMIGAIQIVCLLRIDTFDPSHCSFLFDLATTPSTLKPTIFSLAHTITVFGTTSLTPWTKKILTLSEQFSIMKVREVKAHDMWKSSHFNLFKLAWYHKVFQTISWTTPNFFNCSAAWSLPVI